MKTIVYQSFRTANVPDWISRCLGSVRAWAQQRGFEYRFYDDAFFDLVPRELYPRASAHRCVLADYARLVAAKQLLQEGWDRAIWLDADALVFDPDHFTIDVASGFAFCREVWLDRVVLGSPQFRLTVNNSVSVFCRGESIIDFYLELARKILAADQPLTTLAIGTDVLLKLRRTAPFPLLTNVGIFGSEMTERYLSRDERFLRRYLAYQTSPVYALNLCLSHQAPTTKTGNSTVNLHEPLIDHLLADRGTSLNRCFSPSYSPRPNEFDRPLSTYLALKSQLKALLGLFS
jgi:hypothetical protein